MHENNKSTTQRIINPTRTITTATEINNPAGVGCPVVEQESVEQPLVSKNVGGGGQYFDINIIIIIIIASSWRLVKWDQWYILCNSCNRCKNYLTPSKVTPWRSPLPSPSGCSVSSPAYPSYTATWRPSAQPNSFAVVNSPGMMVRITMVVMKMTRSVSVLLSSKSSKIKK